MYVVNGLSFLPHDWHDPPESDYRNADLGLLCGELMNGSGYGVRSLFQGLIWETRISSRVSGVMCDAGGVADVTNVFLSQCIFSFNKTYHDRPDNMIGYFFERQEGIWVGRYRFEREPEKYGFSHCVLTEVSAGFVVPPAPAFA